MTGPTDGREAGDDVGAALNDGAAEEPGGDEPSWLMTWYPWCGQSHRGLRVEMSRTELAHALADAGPHRGIKETLPMICTATFRRDHRCDDDVEHVRMLGLDVDERQKDPYACVAAASAALGGVETFAYSTFSSEPDAYKLRLLVPYDRPASGTEHRESWALVVRVLARVGIVVDRKCCDQSRGFFIWAVPKCGAYFQAHVPGVPWPVGRAADVERKRVAKRAVPVPRVVRAASTNGADVVERARRYVAKMPPAISGAGGHSATFAVARRVVVDFELNDVDAWDVLNEFNGRCKPPWSERELLHKLESARNHARVHVPLVRK